MTNEMPPDPGTPTPQLPLIDKWRAKLLDFSGRNRSLFYRPVANSLTLYLPESELWARLTQDESPLVLSQELTTHPNLLTAEPKDQTAIATSNAAAEKKLRGLQATTRTFSEEQGVHVLHIPIGWLTWTDDTRPTSPGDRQTVSVGGKNVRLVRSPLLFVPVMLERSARGFRLLRLENEAIAPNLTVLNYLKQLFDIEVPLEEEDEIDLDAALAAYRKAVDGREHWGVSLAETSTLDTFSFKKIALLREMERSYDLIAAHPVLLALNGDATALQAATNLIDHTPLDTTVAPEQVALAVPADSSQMKAVLAVADGNSLVIQGPPGTGKSQTITNLISAATARGQQVLFVAEKKAARDVVVSNLEKAGLDDLVLHITEEVATGRTARAKQAIADQLQALLEKGPGQYPADATAPRAVSESRTRLNSYVDALHTPLSALSWSSPYRLFHAWDSARQDLAPDVELPLPSVTEVDDAWLARIRDAAAALDDLGRDVLAEAPGPWLQMLPPGLTLPDSRSLEEALPVLYELQADLMAQVDALGLEEDAWDVPKVTALLQLIEDLEGYQRRQKNPLRFISGDWWRVRGIAQTHIKRGGIIPAGLEGASARLREQVEEWQEALDFADNVFPMTEPTVDGVARLAYDLEATLPSFRPAQRVLQTLANAPIDGPDEDLLLGLIDAGLSDGTVVEVLESALKRHWAAEALRASPEFAVTAAARERLRQRFGESDLALREFARTQSLNAFAPNRPGLDTVAPRESELGVLRAQVAAKRRKPLRWLFSRAPGAILRLKPCIVASPLAVAQFLANRAYSFDLVIFDEASQVPTADAVVAMSRGAQVVVVGDSQQMPPTSFFDRMLGEDDIAEDDFDFESVLQECEALLPARRLLWHYRSQDERLIAFSNQLFYGGSLRTFPSSWAEHPERGVRFEYVAGALYGRGGSRSNPQEAERVVTLLSDELAANPEVEVAVTAMSVAQGDEVQARIESAAQTDARLAAWLEEGNRVKNLETVQGDECDVMLLSFGYGKDAEGNMTLNFGPLSREDGYRRLNVAVTRARRKTVLVASIRAADIPSTVGEGGTLVRRYLDYAERGPVVLSEPAAAAAVVTQESPFEEAVASQLRALGWTVHTQVGVGSYRVDLAVVDPGSPGRYLAGIECDGAGYRAAESARDREIARQQVLERLGWVVLRVWSPDWHRNSDEVVAALDARLRELHGASPVVEAPNAASPTAEPVAESTAVEPEFDVEEADEDQYAIEPEDEGPALTPAPPYVPAEVRYPPPPYVPPSDSLPLQYGAIAEDDDADDRDGFEPIERVLPHGTYLYEPHETQAPDRPLDRWIQQLVIRDGPLHEEELVAALRDDLAGLRLVAPVRTQIERGLAEAVRNVYVRRRDSWYWPPGLVPGSMSVRVNRGANRRAFRHYADEELARAMNIACREAGRLTRDQLPVATARLLGYNLTGTVRQRIALLVEEAVEAGFLVLDDGYYEATVIG